MSDPGINPGIRKFVRLFRDHGFETVDSGDGETHDHECDRDEGYVVIRLNDRMSLVDCANEVMVIMEVAGIRLAPTTGPTIQASYSPIDGFRIIDIHGIHDRMLDPEFYSPNGEVIDE